MVQSNKILTVSYGTFSCTLEGFDDAFGTMKAIAEYFRDLAAEDRYFGAEPPQPDADMLAHIAQQEIARRVEARQEDGGIVLRAQDVAAAAAVAAPIAAETTEAAPEEAVVQETIAEQEPDVLDDIVTPEVEDISDLIAAEVTEPDAEAAAFFAGTQEDSATEEEAEAAAEVVPMAAPAADSIAAKLQRIRAVVSKGNADGTKQDFSEDEHADLIDTSSETVDAKARIADMLKVDPAPTESDDDEDALLDDLNERLEALDPAEEATEVEAAEDDQEQDAAEAAEAEDEAVAEMVEDEAEDEAVAEIAEDEAEDEAVAEIAEDEAEDEAVAEIADDEAEDDAVAEIADDDAEDEAVAEIAEDEAEDDAVAEIADDEAEDEAVAEFEEDEAEDEVVAEFAEDEAEVEAIAEFEEDEAEDEAVAEFAEDDAEDEAVADEAEIVSDDFAQGDIIKVSKEEFDAILASDRGEDLPASDLMDEDEEDDVFEASSLSPEDEEDLMRELAAVEAEMSSFEPVAEVDGEDAQADEEDDVDSIFAEASEDADSDEDFEEERAILSDDVDSEDDVSRLLDEAGDKLSDSETSDRRSEFAHLRAAMAAGKAEEAAGGTMSEAASEGAYREDLARVVKPRRPESAEPGERSLRPQDEKPAPLKLVAAQRIDAEFAPVQPRRIMSSQMEDMGEDGADGKMKFADYADNVGAYELPDLLEAAAAYLSFVEGQEQFSRPQLMTKVRMVENQEFSREDGLRSFGLLLRDGKIEKTQAGRFTVSDRIGFRPEDAREAG